MAKKAQVPEELVGGSRAASGSRRPQGIGKEWICWEEEKGHRPLEEKMSTRGVEKKMQVVVSHLTGVLEWNLGPGGASS